MSLPGALALLPSLLIGSPGPLAAGGETPRAFDGHRGLGRETPLSELLALFYAPTPADERFLADLAALGPRIESLEAEARALHASRGWSPDPEAPDPTTPAEALREAARRLDARARVRAAVLAGWRQDERELRLGLAVLRANTDGWVRTEEEEAHRIAGRADLAASRLRARVLDLEALAEPPGSSGEADPAAVEELAALLLSGRGGSERALALLAGAETRAAAMEELGFLHRLAPSVAVALTRRDEATRRAAELALEVRRTSPDTEEGRAATAAGVRETKTRRRRDAYALARQGLALDPLNEDLAYEAGHLASFVASAPEATSFFDLHLALRGIRLHEDRSFRGRELTPEEAEAKSYLEQRPLRVQPARGVGSGG